MRGCCFSELVLLQILLIGWRQLTLAEFAKIEHTFVEIQQPAVVLEMDRTLFLLSGYLEYHNTADWKPYFELLDRIAGNSIDCHCCFGRTRRGSWAEVAGRLDRIGYC